MIFGWTKVRTQLQIKALSNSILSEVWIWPNFAMLLKSDLGAQQTQPWLIWPTDRYNKKMKCCEVRLGKCMLEYFPAIKQSIFSVFHTGLMTQLPLLLLRSFVTITCWNFAFVLVWLCWPDCCTSSCWSVPAEELPPLVLVRYWCCWYHRRRRRVLSTRSRRRCSSRRRWRR